MNIQEDYTYLTPFLLLARPQTSQGFYKDQMRSTTGSSEFTTKSPGFHCDFFAMTARSHFNLLLTMKYHFVYSAPLKVKT